MIYLGWYCLIFSAVIIVLNIVNIGMEIEKENEESIQMVGIKFVSIVLFIPLVILAVKIIWGI